MSMEASGAAYSTEVAGASSLLRVWLTVREWADPREQVAQLDRDVQRQVLNAVARDVEVDPKARPGKWSLKREVRRRVVATRPATDIIRAARDAKDDLVAHALLFVLDQPKPEDELESWNDAMLAALDMVLSWLPPDTGESAAGDGEQLRRKLAALIARRRRLADVERLTRQAIGQERLVEDIARLLLGESQSGMPVAFAWGVGGSGKSTLVAAIEARAKVRTPPAAVVHLDFDRVTINPTVEGSLDLAFLAQLAAADPNMGAPALDAHAELSRTLELQRRDELERAASSVAAAPSRLSARAQAGLVKATGAGLESVEAVRSGPVWEAAQPYADARWPLLLILDSIEVVEAMGLAAVRQLEKWVAGIGQISGQPDVRILAAGRRSRASPEIGTTWFDPWESNVVEFLIDELDTGHRKQLLENRGLKDTEMLERAASILPGNPLLLKYTAEGWSGQATARRQIETELKDGKIPAAAAERYLDDRLILHVQDPVARPFVVPALALPSVTRAEIEAVLLPTIEPDFFDDSRASSEAEKEDRRTVARKRSLQVYSAFRTATWLMTERPNRRELVMRQDIKAFALTLALRSETHAAQLDRVHRSALNWRKARDGDADRAFEFYHRAMLGEKVAVPPDSMPIYVRLLGSAVEDLPPDVREPLVPATATARADVNVRSGPFPDLDDEAWRDHFEGRGIASGLARELVEADDAMQALQFYRQRPTRKGALPPTAVLRAFAETAEPVEDLGELAEAEFSSMQAGSLPEGPWLERTYWLVRALCMVDAKTQPATLPATVDNAILRVLDDTKQRDRVRFRELFEIAALYFISRNSQAGLVDRYLDWTPRLKLASLFQHRLPQRNFLSLENVAVRQVSAWLVSNAVWQSRILVDGHRHTKYRQMLADLQGKALRIIEGKLPELERQSVQVTDALPRTDAIQILRGLTSEIHRPLRHGLIQAWKPEPHSSYTAAAPSPQREAVQRIIAKTMGAMTFKPAEFNESSYWKLVDSDASAWFGAFVTFADRARLLPQLAHAAIEEERSLPQTSLAKLANVARIFLRWDQALTEGAGSGFQPARAAAN